MSELELALRMLCELINKGDEFPDAQWLVSRAYPNVDYFELCEAYDAQE